jgi:uncharacterized protein (UPF0305 family)
MPFFNKRKSSFIPPNDRGTYLDFYIEAITQEILKSNEKKLNRTNISKEELNSLRSLCQDETIIIKKQINKV